MIDLKFGLTVTQLTEEAYRNACSKDWHEKPREIPEVVALIHEEASETLREYREGRKPTEVYHEGDKPCGIPSELADIVIRVFDAAGEFDIDLEAAIIEKMRFNRTRPSRHGGKVC